MTTDPTTSDDDEPATDGGVTADAAIENDRATVDLPPPTLRNARFGWFSEMRRLHKHHKKRRKLADEGYVQWFLVGDRWPTPRFIKPERNDNGIPQYEYKGKTYLFPESALIPSEQQGLWTAIHKQGDAKPIKPQEPSEVPIPADVLTEYLKLSVTSTAPGFLDGLDLEPADIIKWGMAALVGYVILQSVLGGGLPIGMVMLP